MAGSAGFGRQVSGLSSGGTEFSGKDVEGGWNWDCVALIVDPLSVPALQWARAGAGTWQAEPALVVHPPRHSVGCSPDRAN